MTFLPNVSDEYLIQQFVQGDLRAFDSLYDRYVNSVYNRVRFSIPEMDVEDVTQEVFLAALRSLSKFRGDARFSTWLYKLTNYKIAEYYRKRSRKKETMQVDLELAEQRGDKSNANSLEDHILLKNCLNQLPKLYHEVIRLRFSEEMPFNEIAKKVKKKPEATKSLFRRAIATLRENMKEYNE